VINISFAIEAQRAQRKAGEDLIFITHGHEQDVIVDVSSFI